jgi:diphthamide synthase (EF-2-diphthine--ammonia ligase)
MTGMTAIFPLWGRDTRRLATEMIGAGLRATLVSVDPTRLDPSFAGRSLDASLLRDLPPGVDPCGEHGEFHTFVHDGPMFSRPIPMLPGRITERDGYWYADLLLGNEPSPAAGDRDAGCVISATES